MLTIPGYISVQFNNTLRQRAIPESFYVHYRKWLRYFFDELTRQEVDIVLSHLAYPFDTVFGLLYGCGLRLFEGLGLRVQNFNIEDGILTVHGKGDKDRTIPLPHETYPEIEIPDGGAERTA